MGCTAGPAACVVHLGRSYPREDPSCSGPVPTAKTTLNPAHGRPDRRALHNEPRLDNDPSCSGHRGVLSALGPAALTRQLFIRLTRRVRSRLGHLAPFSASVGMAAMGQWSGSPRSQPTRLSNPVHWVLMRPTAETRPA